MLKPLTIAVALLLNSAAHADSFYVRNADEDTTTRIQCHRIYGCTIRTAPTQSNSARVIQVPEDDRSNISDTWGRGCASCVDLQRSPPSSFEAGR